jgi:hypothetical protein
LDIQEFEKKIKHGSKILIQRGHVHKYGNEFEDGIWIFMGYRKCPTKCGSPICPGRIHLSNNKNDIKGCFRNTRHNNIRLKIINEDFFSEEDFEI